MVALAQRFLGVFIGCFGGMSNDAIWVHLEHVPAGELYNLSEILYGENNSIYPNHQTHTHTHTHSQIDVKSSFVCMVASVNVVSM